MQRLARVFCASLLVLFVSSPRAWSQMVIGTVTEAAERSTLAARAQKVLTGITPLPQPGKDTAEGNTQVKEGQYLLWGELFEKGRTHAVVELGEHIALAHWDTQNAAWTVRQVIKVPVYWMSPEILDSKTAFKPDNLPAKAFWVKQLSPTAPRLLVVSTPHSLYRTGHFVFTFDVTTHQLDAAADFSVVEPTLRDGYVALTNDSGRKAWWGEESFYEVQKDRLKFRGSLRTGSYNGDDSHIHVSFLKPGSSDIVTWRFNATAGNQSTFKIQAGEEEDEKAPIMGHIRFLRPASGTSSEHQGSYLLHKLTGLPTTLVDPNMGGAPPAPLTDRDVEATGNEEVIRLLGPGKAIRNRPTK